MPRKFISNTGDGDAKWFKVVQDYIFMNYPAGGQSLKKFKALEYGKIRISC